MTQHTGIAESRRMMLHEHLLKTLCDPENQKTYTFDCVSIQRCFETPAQDHFYYLIRVAENNVKSPEDRTIEVWLTLDECMQCSGIMDAVNVFVNFERHQLAIREKMSVRPVSPPRVKENLNLQKQE